MKNATCTYLTTLAFLYSTLLAVTTNAGPAYYNCVAMCEINCTLLPARAVPRCVAGCPTRCYDIVMAYFGNDTKVFVSNQEKPEEMDISTVKTGDKVLALEGKELKWTKVLRNTRIVEQSDFIEFKAVSLDPNNTDEKQLTVTKEHGLILIDENGDKIISLAKKVTVGDKIMAYNGEGGEIFTIVSVQPLMVNERYILETESGTILASGILVTTLCSEEVEDRADFDEKMMEWRVHKAPPRGVQVIPSSDGKVESRADFEAKKSSELYHHQLKTLSSKVRGS